MERELRNAAFAAPDNTDNSRQDRLEGFTAAEMADRGPKSMSGFADEEAGAETRPVTSSLATPGGEDGDEDYQDEDDVDIDEADLDDEDLEDDDIEVVSDDEADLDADPLLDEDDEDEDETIR